jgi:hypothetical protein
MTSIKPELISVPNNDLLPKPTTVEKYKNKENHEKKFPTPPLLKAQLPPPPPLPPVDNTPCNFYWHGLTSNLSIPYIIRDNVAFVSVRIINHSVMELYEGPFSQELTNFGNLIAQPIKKAEIDILNEINREHTLNMYGDEDFNETDQVVLLEDFKKFYAILDATCRKKSSPNNQKSCLNNKNSTGSSNSISKVRPTAITTIRPPFYQSNIYGNQVLINSNNPNIYSYNSNVYSSNTNYQLPQNHVSAYNLSLQQQQQQQQHQNLLIQQAQSTFTYNQHGYRHNLPPMSHMQQNNLNIQSNYQNYNNYPQVKHNFEIFLKFNHF